MTQTSTQIRQLLQQKFNVLKLKRSQRKVKKLYLKNEDPNNNHACTVDSLHKKLFMTEKNHFVARKSHLQKKQGSIEIHKDTKKTAPTLGSQKKNPPAM